MANGDTSTDPYEGTGFEAGPGRITTRDTNAGARDGAYARQNIINSFLGFGYYPTESEVASLVGTSMGQGGSEFGAASVANYVNTQKAEIEREKNDPLKAFQKKMTDSADLYKKQVEGLYGQLQDTLGSAPQLFGNLTPDQIDTYLAPLKRSFDVQLANVQSAMGSRGVSGSSTENNALAQTGEQFKENVFSTGLNIGMQSQQAKAKATSDQINALLGLANTEEQLSGSAAKQRSSQGLGQSNLIQSLPFFLSESAKNNQLFQKSMNGGGGFMDTFHQVTSGINEGMGAFQSLAMIPQQFRTTPGGSAPTSPSMGPQTPFNPSGSPGYSGAGSTLLPPNLSLNPSDAALFAA